MSLNTDQAKAFQAYVRTYAQELYTEMFYGFKSATLAQPFEGIKGEHIITQLEIGDNLARRWSKAFNPLANAATLKPRKLKTVPNKVDFSVTPQEYESSYLGQYRKKGQNVGDWPFQAYIMDKVTAKLKQEFEVAFWQGEEESSPADGDYLRQTFDGILKLTSSGIAAGDVTPVSTGSITSSNIIQKFRDMWTAVGVPYKENGTDIFCSYALYDMYRQAYKDAFKIDVAYTEIGNAGYQGIRFEMGAGNTTIIPIAGMGSSQRVIITPRENFALGIDSPDDTMFNVESVKRELHFWMDFRMGAQIILLKDGVFVCNDQA